MAVPPSLPLNSFARKIIKMQGYSAEQEVIEVASIDKISQEEAAWRIAKAREQSASRAAGQHIRMNKVARTSDELRMHVLASAHRNGEFRCATELEPLAILASRKAPPPVFGRWDARRIFRTICLPLHKEGLLREVYDEGSFIGYTLTEAGRKELRKAESNSIQGEEHGTRAAIEKR